MATGAWAGDALRAVPGDRRAGKWPVLTPVWPCFFRSWIGPASPVNPSPSLSLVRLFRRSLPSLQANGWRAGDSVQLESDRFPGLI